MTPGKPSFGAELSYPRLLIDHFLSISLPPDHSHSVSMHTIQIPMVQTHPISHRHNHMQHTPF
ncbi:hypothetical protein BO71DRAFT_397036 [Aspergillus ellipticus CBS 707.79]|uniref:Uncharacterized protein n=1 Tax=Aspergillus ellipticus CBS 707.79 TaxID=1448320 RepID=A0A319DG74_9EURO|nr:hypothetical protein BO71DRAFT_397036 [Aspergillus ellipticus CBS 707.79]